MINKILFLLLLTSFICNAQEEGIIKKVQTVEEEKSEKEEYHENLLDFEYLDPYHEKITNYINSSAISLDKMISKVEDDDQIENNSFGILTYRQNIHTKEADKAQFDVNLRLELPRTEERWKLFLNTNDDELDTLEDKRRNRIIDNSERVTGGFVFSDTKGNWTNRFRIGIRLNSLDNPFLSASFGNNKQMRKKVYRTFRQDFYYYATDGFGSNSSLNFFYDFGDDTIFQSSYLLQYLESNDKKLEFVKEFAYWKQLTENSSIRYTLGHSTNTNDANKTKFYWFNADYKYRVYKDWLFFSVIPEISIREEFDYDPEFNFTFQIQGYFVPNKHKSNINYFY